MKVDICLKCEVQKKYNNCNFIFDLDIAEVNGKIYVICENNLNNRHYHRSLTKKSVKVYDINKRNWSTLDTSLKVSCENILVVVVNKCFI